MAKRELRFELSSGDGSGFSDLKVTSIKRFCELCGDWKDEAFDVCWHSDVPCKASVPDGVA